MMGIFHVRGLLSVGTWLYGKAGSGSERDICTTPEIPFAVLGFFAHRCYLGSSQKHLRRQSSGYARSWLTHTDKNTFQRGV